MKNSWWKLGYRGKVTIPIIIIGAVLVAINYSLDVRNAEKEVIETSLAQGRIISAQISELRRYYTQNVVDPVQKSGLKATHNHGAKVGEIPLPATMVHELNSIFSKKAGYEIRLYSNFPFPFRKDGGARDNFEKEALRVLAKKKDQQFWRIEDYEGVTTLRYATPDVMSAKACVDCHNTHPLSPKTNWQLGDVRGILEVNLALDKTLAAFHHDAQKSSIFVGAFILAMVVSISLFLHHFVIRPLNDVVVIGKRIADGDLVTQVQTTSKDESGRILSTMSNMAVKLNTLIGQVLRSSALVNTSSAMLSAETKQLESVVSEQAATANEIATTSTEIAKTSDQLVETMGELVSMSRDTAASAKGSHVHLDQLESTLGKMAGASAVVSSRLYVINERASKITTVVKTMSKVADLTNLISFNAGIESAKSGEQGRRFGVIAKEIRQLADQSAQAAHDVKQMIEETQTAVSEGVNSTEAFFEEIQRSVQDASNIRAQLEEILESVQTLAPRFETICTGVETQSQGARLINQSITELSQGVQEIVESLHQTNCSIQELTKVSQRLKDETSYFKVD